MIPDGWDDLEIECFSDAKMIGGEGKGGESEGGTYLHDGTSYILARRKLQIVVERGKIILAGRM